MISLKAIEFTQGEFCIKDLNCEITQGEYVIIMGNTGSGKTTILEMICGLRTPTSGEIILNNQNVTNLKPALRGIGYVPQDGALFPGLSVRENLGFALELRKFDNEQIAEKVERISKELKVSHLLDRGITSLSGGEKQRIALGRAIIFKPTVLLFDEPLSALDSETHTELCELLKSISEDRELTIIHVTHNINEADLLGDRLIRLQDGKLISTQSNKKDE